MSVSILQSTFLLTLLLSIGLLFFIRASVKDRTEAVRLASSQADVSLLDQLQVYFTQRAYRIAAADAVRRQVTFEGLVRPSAWLALFLTLLAAIGLLCFVLILSILFPDYGDKLLGVLVLAPIAGAFYWRNAARPEQVLVQLEDASLAPEGQSVVTVTAHRDELAELQRNLPLTRL